MRHSGRRSLRQLWALLLLACTAALALGVGPASAADPASERSPTVLWEEYPLEPTGGPAAQLSLSGIRPGAVEKPSSTNWTLLTVGLALVVLVLSDTVVLTLWSRVLRDT